MAVISATRSTRRAGGGCFAEGAQGFFSTFFLLANSGTAEATVRFTFLVELGDAGQHTMTVPPAARRTFYAGDFAALVNRSFATID